MTTDDADVPLWRRTPRERPEPRVERFDGPEIKRRGKPPLQVSYQVTYVDGDEGERLRAEIADATRDLLRHFANEQNPQQHRAD